MEPEKMAATGMGPEGRPRASSDRREAADRAFKVVGEGVDQAVAYGKEHPGASTLIAFGAGLALGLALSSGFRRRRSRYPEIAIETAAKVASEYFRTR